MDYSKDMPGESTCTTCQMSEDFSNYWTAILYFKARNGTYKRVHQLANSGFEGAADGGMTVYYMQDPLYDTAKKSKVQAFQPVSLPNEAHSTIIEIFSFDFNCIEGIPYVYWGCSSTQSRGRCTVPSTHLHLPRYHGQSRARVACFPKACLPSRYNGIPAISNMLGRHKPRQPRSYVAYELSRNGNVRKCRAMSSHSPCADLTSHVRGYLGHEAVQ